MLEKLLKLLNKEVFQSLLSQPLAYQPDFINDIAGTIRKGGLRLTAMATELSVPAFAAYTIYGIIPAGTKTAASKLSVDTLTKMLPTAKDVTSKLSVDALTKMFSSTSTLKTSGITFLTPAFGLYAAYYTFHVAMDLSLVAANRFVDADRSDPSSDDSQLTKLFHPLTQFVKNYVFDRTQHLIQVGDAYEDNTRLETQYVFGGSAKTEREPFKKLSKLIHFSTVAATTALACATFAKALPLVLGKGNVVETGKLLGLTMGAVALAENAKGILSSVFDTRERF